MNLNEPASTGQTSYLAGPDGRVGYDVAGTGPIRRVSVLSTGQVQIHPDHEAATWRPVPIWLLASRRWTAPRPINAYVIEHCDGLVLFDTGQDRASVTDPGYFPGGVTRVLYDRLARFEIGPQQTLTAGLDRLGAAGPFLHTAAPLAAACLAAGVHYLDIGNELQVFAALYDLDERARQAGVAVIPGTGFGVVATNCLARYVSDAVGGAQTLEVAARAATAQPGPGIAASVRENLPYGGWTRRTGRLHPQPLGSGITTVAFPDGPCHVMPFPTGDLEAAFLATGAPGITAYSPVPADSAAAGPQAPPGTGGPAGYRSRGLAVLRVGASHRPGRRRRTGGAGNR